MPESHPDPTSTLRAAIQGISADFPDRQLDGPAVATDSKRNLLLVGIFLGAGLLGYWLGRDPLDLEF